MKAVRDFGSRTAFQYDISIPNVVIVLKNSKNFFKNGLMNIKILIFRLSICV